LVYADYMHKKCIFVETGIYINNLEPEEVELQLPGEILFGVHEDN